VSLAAQRDRVGRDGEGSKVLFGEFDEGIVLDSTCSDENHPVRSVVFGNVPCQVVSANRVDVLFRAENGVSERLSCTSAFGSMALLVAWTTHFGKR
jgi:hypothetical protein